MTSLLPSRWGPARRPGREITATASAVVADGSVDVSVDGETTGTLWPGEFFGEIAILRDVPRTATVVAREPTRLYALERDDFLAAVTGSAAGRRGVCYRLAAGRRPAEPRLSRATPRSVRSRGGAPSRPPRTRARTVARRLRRASCPSRGPSGADRRRGALATTSSRSPCARSSCQPVSVRRSRRREPCSRSSRPAAICNLTLRDRTAEPRRIGLRLVLFPGLRRIEAWEESV